MLGSIIGLFLSGSVKHTAARIKRSSMFIAVAGILILTAYVFALVALALWLGTLYGLIYASLTIVGICLLIAIVLFIVMASINAQHARRARERRLAAESMATAGISLLRSQPMLASAVLGAFLLSTITGSRRDD